MTQKLIKIGDKNGRQGDSLFQAFTTINENFNELYAAVGLDLLNVASDIIPATDNTYNIGSPSKRWKHGYFATGSLYVGDIKLSNDNGTLLVQQVTDAGLISEEPIPDAPGIVTTDRIVNGANTFAITAAGALELNGSPFTGGGNTGDLAFIENTMYGFTGLNINNADLVNGATAGVNLPSNGALQAASFVNTYGDIQLTAGINNSTTSLYFTGSGDLQLPSNGSISQYGTWTKTIVHGVTNGTPTIVWTSHIDAISSAKLLIQVECNETGDTTGWHSQACEAIISCRGYANTYGGPGGDPQISVYGVVHTSVDPLVTFTVQRNPTTKKVEVVGTATATASGNPSLKIHSVEMSTND